MRNKNPDHTKKKKITCHLISTWWLICCLIKLIIMYGHNSFEGYFTKEIFCYFWTRTGGAEILNGFCQSKTRASRSTTAQCTSTVNLILVYEIEHNTASIGGVFSLDWVCYLFNSTTNLPILINWIWISGFISKPPKFVGSNKIRSVRKSTYVYNYQRIKN